MLAKAKGMPDEDIEYALLPCPFCGLDAASFANCQEMRTCEGFRRCAESRYVIAVCSFNNGGCGASTGFWPSAEEAAKAWNERAKVKS